MTFSIRLYITYRSKEQQPRRITQLHKTPRFVIPTKSRTSKIKQLQMPDSIDYDSHPCIYIIFSAARITKCIHPIKCANHHCSRLIQIKLFWPGYKRLISWKSSHRFHAASRFFNRFARARKLRITQLTNQSIVKNLSFDNVTTTSLQVINN